MTSSSLLTLRSSLRESESFCGSKALYFHVATELNIEHSFNCAGTRITLPCRYLIQDTDWKEVEPWDSECEHLNSLGKTEYLDTPVTVSLPF